MSTFEPCEGETTGTSTALALASLWLHVGIGLIQRMAMNAMRFTCILRGMVHAPEHVQVSRYRLQVVRPNTGSIAAKMIQGQAFRNGANADCVSVAMGQPRLHSNYQSSVTLGLASAMPHPAPIGLLDLCPETLLWSHTNIVTHWRFSWR